MPHCPADAPVNRLVWLRLDADADVRVIFLDALDQLLNSTHYTITSEQESATAKNNSRRLNRIIDHISEHYMDHITLQDIADLEQISTYHVSHFITQMLGISFQDYLNNIRFEHAFQLIDKSNMPILDVCFETGFSSSRYLNQMFIRKLGCSVKEYRKSQKKPHLIDVALPTDNIQKRYSFEQAAFVFRKKKGILPRHNYPSNNFKYVTQVISLILSKIFLASSAACTGRVFTASIPKNRSRSQ